MAYSYIRYILAKSSFHFLGLPVDRFRREVENLWALNESTRMQEIGKMLAQNSPANAEGIAVKTLESLKVSPYMCKDQFRAMRKSQTQENLVDILQEQLENLPTWFSTVLSLPGCWQFVTIVSDIMDLNLAKRRRAFGVGLRMGLSH